MKRSFVGILAVIALSFLALPARADFLFETIARNGTIGMNGGSENPPNASPGTGFGTVILNDAMTQITVDLTFSGLVANATAAHLHAPANFSQNAGVVFGFTGVPAATSGSIPTQTFAINATQVAQLFSGLFYMNVHTSTFPGGEIRGQMQGPQLPEPGSLLLTAAGVIGLGAYGLRRRVRVA